MTVEEIATCEDVSVLYDLQRTAERDGSPDVARAAARRLRDLAGGNTNAQPYRPAIEEMPPVIVSPSDMGAGGG